MASTYTATNAIAYERLMGRWSRRLAPEFLDFVGLLPGTRVLDVGCGTGSLAASWSGRGNPAIGLDIAPAYVDFAAARSFDAARLAYVAADAQSLPFAAESADATLSLLALNFVAEPGRALAEMIRVTRPGGVVGAAVWDFTGGLVYQRLFWDTAAALDSAAERARARHYGHPLTRPGGLALLFAETTLAPVLEVSLTIRMEFERFHDYWQPIVDGQGPLRDYVRTAEPAMLERVAAGVRSAYLSGLPDGPRSLAATAIAVKAVKTR
jgi:SAM-dependent methyltransferase